VRFLSGFIKKTFSRRNVLQGLGDALDDKQKAWAREHLNVVALYFDVRSQFCLNPFNPLSKGY